LVALALTGGTPANSSAGKVIKVPPPAIELSMPPNNPAMNSSGNSDGITNPACNFQSDQNSKL
jgi:hypothetical protein